MHIAIDVHSIGSRAAGNETYFHQLLRGLALDKSDHRYSLFYTHSNAPQNNPLDARFQWIRVPQNRFPRMCWALPRALRQLMPDVFHCQYALPPFTRSKTVVTIHDLSHEHFPGLAHPVETLMMRKVVRATARRADRVLTVSEFCARDIIRTYGIPDHKVAVAYQTVADKFRPRDKVSAQRQLVQKYGVEPPFLLYVGRLQARKNLPRLLEAYSLARKQGVTEKLVLVGKRDYGAEQVFAKMDELELRKFVVLPGYVSADDLPLFYNAAEAFLFPSLFEGFGLPVVEAMASELPVVTSLGSSLEEVAGEAAILVDPLDVAALATAIVRIVQDTDLRRTLAERGLRRSREFTPEKFASKVLQIYAEIKWSRLPSADK